MKDKTKYTFADVANELIKLHDKKDNNYGNSYSKLFADLGEVAGLVPLHNKLDRLTNLVKNPTFNFFESKEDTLMDLASYAIMMLVELRNAHRTTIDDGLNIKECESDKIKDFKPQEGMKTYKPGYTIKWTGYDGQIHYQDISDLSDSVLRDYKTDTVACTTDNLKGTLKAND